jgi:hypothetical protein
VPLFKQKKGQLFIHNLSPVTFAPQKIVSNEFASRNSWVAERGKIYFV